MGLFISSLAGLADATPRQFVVNFGTSSVTLDARDRLTVVGFPETSYEPPACSRLLVSAADSLQTIYMTHCQNTESIVVANCVSMQTVDMAGVEILNATEFRLTGASLQEASADAVLIALAAGSGVNGIVDLSGGFNQPPSSSSAAARSTLSARGWTITTV